MIDTMWLQVLVYFALLFFLAAFIWKAVRYARMPIHLRWELYPVAHEARRKYGGSYLEELDWGIKPRRKSYWGEFRYILREGLLFEKCYRNNRGLWYFTYPFHMGLFLLILWLVLLFTGALVLPAGTPATESGWVLGLNYLILGAGLIGLVLGILGCAGLLIKRLTSESLRIYTPLVDYFNLLFILAVLLSGLFSWYFYDPAFATARASMKSIVTFSPVTNLNPAMTISIMLFSLLLVYLPFTRMMHALAKYFTYHRVFWEDEPNIRGGDIEKKVKELLNQPVSWAAPHIQQDKRWGEVATEEAGQDN